MPSRYTKGRSKRYRQLDNARASGSRTEENYVVGGPAGAGKTAIAGSVADTCEEKGLLAASFFFSSYSKSANRRSKRYVVPTLAYQLVQTDKSGRMRDYILAAIQLDPAVFDKRLSSQMGDLVLKPLGALRGSVFLAPQVIIIDGVDEIEAVHSRDLLSQYEARQANEADQLEVLSVLLKAASHPAFPFRILIVSRPERVIQDFFDRAAETSRSLFLDNKYNPSADIELFLRAKFAETGRRYHLPSSWPSDQHIRILVEKASGQFVYAATVIRFVQSGPAPPQVQLDRVLNLPQVDMDVNPFAPLDALYTHILGCSPDPILAVRWITLFDMWLASSPAVFTRQLLQDYPGHADYLLENLASLIGIPSCNDLESGYTLHHKSLVDFLRDPRRCGPALSAARDNHAHFYIGRVIQVLKDRFFGVELSEPEWRSFLRIALDKQFHTYWYRFNHWLTEDMADDLSRCDVAWWMRRIVPVLRCNEAMGETPGPNHVAWVFRLAHFNCPSMWESPGAGCSAGCKHWRSNILHVFRSMGWSCPGTLDLVHEMLWLHARYTTSAYFEHDDLPPFRGSLDWFLPTKGPGQVSAPLVDDYDSILRLLKEVHAHFPSYWQEQYREDIEQGIPPQSGFANLIESILAKVEVVTSQ
ncbi:hypothetical protein NMY22_g13766 [Coprinellus aureogranulatus]|nr:hypothetical protein NMY22_g13766 [Coprinellus aureogranulatus]